MSQLMDSASSCSTHIVISKVITMATAYIGSFVDTPEAGLLRLVHDHALVVDAFGHITHFAPVAEHSVPSECKLYHVSPGSFLLPSFTDLHLHCPQYLYAGNGLDLPLLEWLERYTYPAEERIDADLQLARTVYAKLIQRLREVGTGATVAFGTIGVEANLVLADEFRKAGLRAFVGKLSMDCSPRATYNESSTDESIKSITSFIDAVEQSQLSYEKHERLVHPVITPRFVPVCSDELLFKLGALAKERNVMIQSHMCESRDQIDWVRAQRGREDEDVFDNAGLLTPKTIQAHVTTLPRPLMVRLKERGSSVAHCPLSNIYFSDAQFPLRESLDAGLSVGLGSDIAGGYALDLQVQMRNAVAVARMRDGQRKELAVGEQSATSTSLRVDWKESLYLATRGGAQAVGLEGMWRVGSPFDAQQLTLIDASGMGVGALDFFDSADQLDEAAIEKWWCLGDPRNRTGMWIQGRAV